MDYRGYTITLEPWDGETIIWVETPDGPFDAPTVDLAKAYIDAMIEEEAAMAQGASER